MDEKAKILIVENERTAALELKHKLESMGYGVSAIVSSGEEAIKELEDLHLDLVLMGIILRGEMGGVEAVSQIHTRFDIPVVYVIANVRDARLEDITRSESFGCLFKPFEDMELQAAVKMALYKYRIRKVAEDEIISHQEHLALINQILRHDLTNDLVVIQSALNIYNKSPEQKLLKEISSRTKKSLGLINRMRELEFFISRHSNLKPYKMNDAIDEVIKSYPSICFEVKGKAHVMADDSIVSVIDNIIKNAVTHGKADRITITTHRERDMCEARIADNGTGISDEIKAKVFEEGFTHGDTGHSGIGLHIVKKAMENYGGYTWVEDNKPNGAVFVMRFRMVK
ncbi:MAG: hybrid sensor histidine kinase/response regulator [Thermodesulfobacteriota bacterium]|nr:hybrid sensor histidine kinase/response regulator [Thermodesulfobacteriota bacterium]